jgi:hypothetical protein
VHFAEPRSVIAVLLGVLAYGPRALGDQRVIARIACIKLGNDAAGNRMMVSSRYERCTGRGAECRGMECVEAEPAISKPVKGRSPNWTAECTGCSEADIIGHYQENIRSTLSCRYTL